MDNPILLPLRDGLELEALKTALVMFAQSEDDAGDAMGYAKVCDRIADRVEQLNKLASADIHETLRGIGLGPTYRRPQG